MNPFKDVAERIDALIDDCMNLGVSRNTLDKLEDVRFDIKRNDLSDVPELNDTEKFLVDKGYQVQAIKAYRERTQMGLYQSKLLTDNYRFNR